MYMSNLYTIRKVLFLTRDEDIVKEVAEKQFLDRFTYVIHALNSQWNILSVENSLPDFWQLLSFDWLDISNSAPLLAFEHDTIDLNYRLLNDGQVISSLDVKTGIEDDIWDTELQTQYPNHTPKEIRVIAGKMNWQEKYEEIRQSNAYRTSIDTMYANHESEQFSILSLDTIQIQRMRVCINAKVYVDGSITVDSQTQIFLELLGLDGISENYRF